MTANTYIRKQFFIDPRLQGYLLGALVLLELVLLASALAYFYLQVDHSIALQMFRIHQPPLSLIELLVRELGQLLGVILLLNTAVLLAAHWLWSRHIHQVRTQLQQQLSAIARLDLRPIAGLKPGIHSVCDHMQQWREQEILRVAAVRDQLAQLPVNIDQLVQSDSIQLQQCLQRVRQLLEQPPLP